MGSPNIDNQGLPKSTYQIDEAMLASLLATNVQLAFLQSTISQSNQEMKLSPLLAGSPRLSPADASSFVQQTQIEMGKISLAVLTAWGKALEEAREIVKRELTSPAYLARQEEKHNIALHKGETGGVSSPKATDKVEADLVERYMWLNSLSGLVSALIQMNSSGSQGVSQVSSIDKGPQSLDPASTSGILAPQFLLLGVANSAIFQGGALVGAASAIDGLHAESKVMQGTWGALTNQSNDPSSLIAGWVSSLWGIGLIYQLSADNMKTEGTTKQGNKPADINFAKTYAETILGAVSSGQFATSIEAAVANATGKSTTSAAPDTTALVAKAKIALLSVALALLLKLEEGTTSEPVFSGLFKGEVDLTQNDPYNTSSIKRALLDEIKQMLTTLEPEDRSEVLYNLLGYMAKDPAVEEMMDQQKVFKNVLNNTAFENELIDKRPLDV